MAGIYIHIPYCRTACNYCNFHFSTTLHSMEEMMTALTKEIQIQHEYLKTSALETIYFGGGTPSLLLDSHWHKLLAQIKKYFFWQSDAVEFTIEVNPEDVHEKNIELWLNLGINRFSVGVQSFFQEDLAWMNRAHTAEKSFECLLLFKKYGIKNINVDLIYGLPQMSATRWQQNLNYVAELGANHLSAYALTVEPRTALASLIHKKKFPPVLEEPMVSHFHLLSEWAKEQGFEQYEISNFAKNCHYSKHNTAYWQGKSYLGIGPGAHSFNGISRQWNVSNNIRYINALKTANSTWYEVEILTEKNRWNEKIMTQLRTKWGLDVAQLATEFPPDFCAALWKDATPYLANKMLCHENHRLLLSTQGKLLADSIISDLMQV